MVLSVYVIHLLLAHNTYNLKDKAISFVEHQRSMESHILRQLMRSIHLPFEGTSKPVLVSAAILFIVAGVFAAYVGIVAPFLPCLFGGFIATLIGFALLTGRR